MSRLTAALITLSLLLPPAAHAAHSTVIVGGGSSPDSTQGSIEMNVIWLTDLLREQPDPLHVFFNAGADSNRDVYRRRPDSPAHDPYEALARVFDMQRANRDEYYTNRVDYPAGSTEAGVLIPELESLARAMQAGDSMFFIYNGHGLGRSNYRDNTLRVWQDTEVSVTRLETIFSGASERSTLRYFMPQCYAGGFDQLAYKNADPAEGLSAQTRCGFMSVPRTLPAEGCTPSVDTGDFRDYSTYFFGALSGKTRDGGPLTADPDFDGNGAVNLLEAHYYSMVYAQSADIPRSTSEEYLLRQRPWTLRWLRTRQPPDNVYTELTRRLAAQLELRASWDEMNARVLERIDALRADKTEAEQRWERLNAEQQAIQDELQEKLFFRWPELKTPYTAGYAESLDNIATIDRFLRDQPVYPELVELQNRMRATDLEILSLQRKTGRLLRLRRLRDLAYALKHFERTADENEKAGFERLRNCERWEPGIAP